MRVETLRELASPAAITRDVMRLLVALLVLWLAVLLVYRTTVADMLTVWNNSTTYGHCFLVLPIALWMVWTRRSTVPWRAARPCLPVIAGLLAAGIAWTFASIASVASGEQLALVVMLQLAVVGVLGPVVSRALLLPILFLLFAVPLGEFLTPTLIDRTADFTVAALQATGIPVYREGNDFLIPTGRWSVVEACSGVRYLFASLMAGTAFAYLQYSSWKKRAVFMAASLVVPIVANWLRAYLIVLTGHLSSNEIAVGADHLIYGAVFFGIIIFTLFAIGNRFRDSEASFAQAGAEVGVAPRSASTHLVFVVAALGVAATLWAPLPAAVQSRLASTAAELSDISAPLGWSAAQPVESIWKVEFRGARKEVSQSFARDGTVVTLRIGYFTDQRPNFEMISWAHDVLRGNDQWRPMLRAKGRLTDHVETNAAILQNAAERVAVRTLYRVGGRYTADEYAAKLWTLYDTVVHGKDEGVMVIAYAVGKGDRDPGAALDRFLVDAFPAIDSRLDEALRR